MQRYETLRGEQVDPVLEAIVLEGRCECCEEVLSFFEQLMGKTQCKDCRRERASQISHRMITA